MRLIDADALMKEFTEFVKDSNNSDFADVPTWNDAVSLVGSMPSAQPEQKKGKWIETTQGDHYKCSCCGVRSAFWFDEENSSSWEKDMSEWLSGYCPNCGADMRERREDAEIH